MTFVDFKKYLQEKMSEVSSKEYIYSNERQLDSDNFEGEVVIKALSGNVFDESATIPYQIEITTADPDAVMEDFTKLALKCNNKSFTSIVNQSSENYESYTITPFFNTPVIIDSNIQVGSNAYARIVVFAQINAVLQVADVQSIEIDGEEIKFQNATLGYTTELVPNKISGVELTPSKKRTSSAILTFLMVNKANVFNNKIFQIMTGQLPGNTSFGVVLKMTNGLTATLTMALGTSNFNSQRLQLPSIQISLYLYDSRGDSNA